MVGLLGCKYTLSAHVQLFIHQYPQVLLCRAALNPFIPQPVLILGVAVTHVQDLALGLVEPHEVHMGPLLKLVQVLLDGIPSFWHVNRTTQLGVICKLAEDALNPTVYVTDEDIKQYWSRHGPLMDTTSVDHYPLDATIQTIPHPPNSPPIKSISLQFREKDVVGDHSPGTSPDCNDFSNIMESGLATTSASSLRTLGCISSGPIDLFELQLRLGLPDPIPTQPGSIPVLFPGYLSLLPLPLTSRSRLIHAGLLPSFPDFLHLGIERLRTPPVPDHLQPRLPPILTSPISSLVLVTNTSSIASALRSGTKITASSGGQVLLVLPAGKALRFPHGMAELESSSSDFIVYVQVSNFALPRLLFQEQCNIQVTTVPSTSSSYSVVIEKEGNEAKFNPEKRITTTDKIFSSYPKQTPKYKDYPVLKISSSLKSHNCRRHSRAQVRLRMFKTSWKQPPEESSVSSSCSGLNHGRAPLVTAQAQLLQATVTQQQMQCSSYGRPVSFWSGSWRPGRVYYSDSMTPDASTTPVEVTHTDFIQRPRHHPTCIPK
ncbi:hypothetical protein QYF61_026433 [Mycteria americana]|uniref:Uncharacterized protein n=1 Tax=Mycteria americana TaxID=33587 RepID=A0AAN7PX40_MYCAM|nr:hypothetical protein QYF61_026433 [Mycteria americana]